MGLVIKRNSNFAKLSSRYLFREIENRRREFARNHPEAQLISLGIGDTTEPLPHSVTEALKAAAHRLGTREGYLGYSQEQGFQSLRKKISDIVYQTKIQPEEIFISDGAKCDIGRLQLLFGEGLSIAVQDPSYPVYIDGSILQGVKEIIPLPCTPENGFFPSLNSLPRVDLIYFCSPNNPTGAVATHAQLEELVHYAKKNQVLIIFDAAYASFIREAHLPRSIYEIKGAEEVAIETNSFSKWVGFTGVRLGWTVVPERLKYSDGTSIRSDWERLTTTLFNGASNIAQYGGLATLEIEGLQEADKILSFYLENAAILKESLLSQGCKVYGGDNAPYLWVSCEGTNSWELFQSWLENLHLVVTPGSGFGTYGEGFFRLSAFNSRENILIAKERLRVNLKMNSIQNYGY